MVQLFSIMLKVSQQQLRNLLILHSGLEEKSDDLLASVNSLSCLQVDPIAVVAKNHELILYNRVNNLTRGDLERTLYEDRSTFEYWLQLYSVIPITSFPHLRLRMRHEGKWRKEYYAENKAQLDATISFIEDHGPTSVNDLEHIPKSRSVFSWTGAKTNSGLLSYLWDCGILMVHHREKERKYYDLTERLLPKDLLTQTHDDATSVRFLIETYFDYFGLVRPTQFSRLGYVRQWGAKEALADLRKSGVIQEIEVAESGKKYLIHQKHLPTLEAAAQITPERLLILPPLDPLVLDREILHDIFNFYYRWEAYTPAVKRKYGFYNMPVLLGNEIVGQVVLEKIGGELVLKEFYPEAEVSKQSILPLLQAEVNKLGEFVFSK